MRSMRHQILPRWTGLLHRQQQLLMLGLLHTVLLLMATDDFFAGQSCAVARCRLLV